MFPSLAWTWPTGERAEKLSTPPGHGRLGDCQHPPRPAGAVSRKRMWRTWTGISRPTSLRGDAVCAVTRRHGGSAVLGVDSGRSLLKETHTNTWAVGQGAPLRREAKELGWHGHWTRTPCSPLQQGSGKRQDPAYDAHSTEVDFPTLRLTSSSYQPPTYLGPTRPSFAYTPRRLSATS